MKPRMLAILIIPLTALLVVAWQTSVAAIGMVRAEGDIAHLSERNQAGDAGINQSPAMAPGVVLIGLKPAVEVSSSGPVVQVSDASLGDAFGDIGVQGIEPVFPSTTGTLSFAFAEGDVDLHRIYRLWLVPDTDIPDVVRRLRQNPAVVYAEPDYLAHIVTAPNDPLYSGQWGVAQINAPAAWDVVTGTTDLVVAVIDAGLDTTHPDLAGQLWTNPGEIAGNSLDDDNNGYVDDIHGWNLVDNNADLSDNTGHGTQVAGVIAAATDNSEGVAGVCWNCRLMIVKVSQPSGVANYSDIAAGVAYAAQKGAEVINLSLGGYSDSATLRAAVAAASETAVVVGGAGNDDSGEPFYPAAYDDYVLAVASTDISDTRVSASNYGAWVDVSAPGEVITTTFSGGGYGPTSGTSMAAAYASGLAGLLRSQYPGWSANMARAQIVHTTDDIDSLNPGYEGKLGSGRINASQAVVTEPVPGIQFVNYVADGQTGGALKTGATVPLAVTLQNDWLDASSVMAMLSTTDGAVSVTKGMATWGAIDSGQSATNNADPFQVSVAAGQYSHAIPFSLQVDADGNVSTLTFTATTESAVVNVGGTLGSDTVWTNDRIYLVTDHLIVSSGVTLTIQPGTIVKFNEGRALIVNGTLIGDGTATSPIRFTSAAVNPAPGDWGTAYGGTSAGIVFSSSSQPAVFDGSGNYQGGSIIRYGIIEYGKGLLLRSSEPFIDHNLIWKNVGEPGVIYVYTAEPIISNNKIASNTGGSAIHLYNPYNQYDATLRHNLFIDNSMDTSVIDGNGTVISNTITGNVVGPGYCGGIIPTTVCVDGGSILLRGNNIYMNQSNYDVALRYDTGQPVTAILNYWGTTNPTEVASRIYDLYGLVMHIPFLTQPEPTAPPLLYQLSLNPASPVGIQQVTFELTFSGPMDQSINPAVTFGAIEPYTTYFVFDNAQWVTEMVWRATYDITSLIPRGSYTISVSGAKDTDGMEILADTRFGFTVDYAGEITDQTPPNPPSVIAAGKEGDPSTVEAMWLAGDPDSPITGYRYAIGSAAGAADIVNWTTTTSTSLTRSGLGLVEGRQYWLAVQARNVGGLWSARAYATFISGQPLFEVFLPLTLKKR